MQNVKQQPEEILDMASQPKFRISWQIIFVGLMFFYMYLPIFVLTFYSFNQSRYSAGWEGFT
ncbi:MAG: spermidine/putrescine ABC transporter permease PotC, partial [Planktothrix sp.]